MKYLAHSYLPLSPKEYETWWSNWTKAHPENENTQKARMQWLQNAMTAMNH